VRAALDAITASATMDLLREDAPARASTSGARPLTGDRIEREIREKPIEIHRSA
jgi:hypothetical protein